MQEKVILQATLPSIIHNREIVEEILKFGKEKNYPVQKAKFSTPLEKYVGFAKEYMVTADRLPPIPGGWNLQIISFQTEEKEIMLNVQVKEENGKMIGEINKLVMRMLDEYRKEGLDIEVQEEPQKFYGNWVRVLKAVGHPIILDQLEDFIENMR